MKFKLVILLCTLLGGVFSTALAAKVPINDSGGFEKTIINSGDMNPVSFTISVITLETPFLVEPVVEVTDFVVFEEVKDVMILPALEEDWPEANSESITNYKTSELVRFIPLHRLSRACLCRVMLE